MAFREDSASGVGERDRERAAVFEAKNERRTNQVRDILVRRQIDRALDPMQPGDRQSVSGGESLISRDPVANLAKHFALAAQVAHTHAFFDELHS